MTEYPEVKEARELLESSLNWPGVPPHVWGVLRRLVERVEFLCKYIASQQQTMSAAVHDASVAYSRAENLEKALSIPGPHSITRHAVYKVLSREQADMVMDVVSRVNEANKIHYAWQKVSELQARLADLEAEVLWWRRAHTDYVQKKSDRLQCGPSGAEIDAEKQRRAEERKG